MPRGSRPGERRGGRQKGSLNHITRDLKAIAQAHGPAVISELARLAGVTKAPGARAEATRVAAMRELLDRGYGKATQHITGDAEHPVAIAFSWAPAQQPNAVDTESNTPTIDANDAALKIVWDRDGTDGE